MFDDVQCLAVRLIGLRNDAFRMRDFGLRPPGAFEVCLVYHARRVRYDNVLNLTARITPYAPMDSRFRFWLVRDGWCG